MYSSRLSQRFHVGFFGEILNLPNATNGLLRIVGDILFYCLLLLFRIYKKAFVVSELLISSHVGKWVLANISCILSGKYVSWGEGMGQSVMDNLTPDAHHATLPRFNLSL